MAFLCWCGEKEERPLVRTLFGLGRKKIEYFGNLFKLLFFCGIGEQVGELILEAESGICTLTPN